MWWWCAAAWADSRATVWLEPLGAFPVDLEQAIEAKLEAELQVDVQRLDPVDLPAVAWYPPRQRWRADRLIEWLPARAPGVDRVLGLATADISATKEPYEDWGLFGLGALGGRGAVMSTYRLRRHADADRLRFRVESVAAHEVGHLLGLDHCTEPGCLMLDAEGGIANTDTGTGHLGPECRAKLDRLSPLR